jgi:hypothetical protein
MTCHPADLQRLIKLLEMLASPFAAERAVAGLKITEFLRAHNQTWTDIIQPRQSLPVLTNGGVPHHYLTELERKVAFIRDNVHRLNRWERDFVQKLHQFRRLSPKQHAIVDKLTLKVRRAA